MTETGPSPAVGEVLPVVDARCDSPECKSRTSESYTVPGRCLNCGQRFVVLSRKGDKTPLAVECPNCEVDGYSWQL